MTIGQLFGSIVGNWCATKGTHTDATIFKKIDIESIGTELENLGMNRYGYHRLYNGVTGEFIDTEIFMGPTYYQRLQKIEQYNALRNKCLENLEHLGKIE